MHSSTKKAAEPKRLTKNGKVYGDLLSAEEKKKLVLQKKKAKKTKKVRQSAQQTIQDICIPADFLLTLLFFYHQDDANAQQYCANEFYSKMFGFMEQKDCKQNTQHRA